MSKPDSEKLSIREKIMYFFSVLIFILIILVVPFYSITSLFIQDPLVLISIILFIAGVLLIYNLHKSYLLHLLFKRIQWCRSSLTFDYLNSLGFEFVEKKYCFNYYEDQDFISDSLKEFSHYMQSCYFNKTLSSNKAYRKLSDKEYILLHLACYLENLDTRNKFVEQNILEYTLSDEPHKSSYSLTKYGYAFYKLWYIISTFCESNTHIRQHHLYNARSAGIKDILDNGQITYYNSRY